MLVVIIDKIFRMKNRILSAVILLIFLSPLKAESPPLNRLSKTASSKDIRFMIGFKGGINFVQPVVTQKFNIFNPIDGDVAQSGTKTYRPFFSNPGYQYAFTALYKLNNSMDVRLEPTFSIFNYKYSASYFWISTGSNSERIDMSVRHLQNLNYLDIPVSLRLLIGSGTVRPFVQGGLFYGFLLNAIKESGKTEIYTNDINSTTLNSMSETGDARPLYVRSRYGFNAGAGFDYDLSAVRLTLDINLNFGINRVTNEAGRYSVPQFTGGLYDVQDNIRLFVPSINIGIIFPLQKPARSKLVCLI